jgi:hypothetical protein
MRKKRKCKCKGCTAQPATACHKETQALSPETLWVESENDSDSIAYDNVTKKKTLRLPKAW